MKIKNIINHNWTITIIGGITVGIILTIITPPIISFLFPKSSNKTDTTFIPTSVKQEISVILPTPVLQHSSKEIKEKNKVDVLKPKVKKNPTSPDKSYLKEIPENRTNSLSPEPEKVLVIYGKGYSDKFTENEARITARENALNHLLGHYKEDTQKAIVKRYKITITDTVYKTVRGTWEGKCQYSFDEKYLKSHAL